MKFSSLSINENIKKALLENNFFDATEIQEKTINHILEQKDILARSQTGSGKTLAYALPIVEKSESHQKAPQGLVVCPTRELALQVCDEFRKITKYIEGIKAVPIYGGSDITRQIQALKRGATIVVGTPGRIIDHLNRKTLKLHNIKTLVLDEADEMLNMGFKEDIEEILKSAPQKKQILMFSATYPINIKNIANTFMTDPVNIEIGSSNKSIKKINQLFAFVGRTQKQAALVNILNKYIPKTSIIFCNTKRMCEELGEFLNSQNFFASVIHGDLRQSERKRVMQSIKTNQSNLLVATDVAARGIDINDVDYVINYDLPNNVEYLIHRMGRTARAGKSGNSITIINTPAQLKLLQQYNRETESDSKEIDLGSEFVQRLTTLNKSGRTQFSESAPRSRKPSFKDKPFESFNKSKDKNSDKKDGFVKSKKNDYDKKEGYNKFSKTKKFEEKESRFVKKESKQPEGYEEFDYFEDEIRFSKKEYKKAREDSTIQKPAFKKDFKQNKSLNLGRFEKERANRFEKSDKPARFGKSDKPRSFEKSDKPASYKKDKFSRFEKSDVKSDIGKSFKKHDAAKPFAKKDSKKSFDKPKAFKDSGKKGFGGKDKKPFNKKFDSNKK